MICVSLQLAKPFKLRELKDEQGNPQTSQKMSPTTSQTPKMTSCCSLITGKMLFFLIFPKLWKIWNSTLYSHTAIQ